MPTSKLILDRRCLVIDELLPFADAVFDDFDSYCCPDNSIVVLSRLTVKDSVEKIAKLIMSPSITVVFDGCAEGSVTLMEQICSYGIESMVLAGKVLVISGGDMYYTYPHLTYDYFASVFTGYSENIEQMQRIDEIYQPRQKPFDFLFLNGRARPHRKYLWYWLNQRGLLNRALWTMLEGRPNLNTSLQILDQGQDHMRQLSPIRRLPSQYEVQKYKHINFDIESDRHNIKSMMFENSWGDVYLQAEPYIDTYFSLVTETVADRPWSFRTEKIIKPIAAGHPWICASGAGFYRDIQNLGFKTFAHAIDESFDTIDNQQDRLNRIVDVVEHLCANNLDDFLESCRSVCKYNQQHLLEFSAHIKADFPSRFFNFVKSHCE